MGDQEVSAGNGGCDKATSWVGSLGGKGLWDPQEKLEEDERRLKNRCPVAEIVMRLGYWVWGRKGNGEGPQLAYLYPRLLRWQLV